MNIQIERRGLVIDGTRYPCTVRQRMGGGDLRLDVQAERGGTEPSSLVVYEYDGWRARRLSLSIQVSSDAPAGGADIRAALSAVLHQASRSGPEPQLHDLGGTMLRAAGATGSPWLVASDPDWTDDGETDELSLEVELIEFDPEIATLRRAQAPAAPRPDPDPAPDDPTTEAGRQRAEQLEQVLIERQRLGPGY